MDETSFRELLDRARRRDEQAAAELVRRYGPALRVAVRARLADRGLRRLMDSADVYQSVLGDFFARAATGQFELERPEQLVGLLAAMARNRLINLTAKHRAARRDQRRLEPVAADEVALAGSEPTPSRVVAGRELLGEVLGRLSDEERQLAEERAGGRAWAEIAAERGAQPNALRMRLARALDRAGRELGVEE
jgi:DNA-directed RNA polymerase specialized sigma24 family protein